jgi:hypothetical protein
MTLLSSLWSHENHFTRTTNNKTKQIDWALASAQRVHGTETQETCTQYNILKIARYLFRWSGAPHFADFYERAILNGLFGVLRMPAGYESHQHDSTGHHLPEPSAPADVR